MNPKISKIQETELENIQNWYNELSNDETENLYFNFASDTLFEMKINELIIGIMSIAMDQFSYADMKRFVRKEYRGKKYGEQFLDYLIKMGKEINIIRITGTIKSENTKGISFLENKGFKMSGSLGIGGRFYEMGILKLK